MRSSCFNKLIACCLMEALNLLARDTSELAGGNEILAW